MNCARQQHPIAMKTTNWEHIRKPFDQICITKHVLAKRNKLRVKSYRTVLPAGYGAIFAQIRMHTKDSVFGEVFLLIMIHLEVVIA
jgi:hypothetical protein